MGSVHLLNLDLTGAHVKSDVWSMPTSSYDSALCLFGILELEKWFPETMKQASRLHEIE